MPRFWRKHRKICALCIGRRWRWYWCSRGDYGGPPSLCSRFNRRRSSSLGRRVLVVAVVASGTAAVGCQDGEEDDDEDCIAFTSALENPQAFQEKKPAWGAVVGVIKIERIGEGRYTGYRCDEWFAYWSYQWIINTNWIDTKVGEKMYLRWCFWSIIGVSILYTLASYRRKSKIIKKQRLTWAHTSWTNILLSGGI